VALRGLPLALRGREAGCVYPHAGSQIGASSGSLCVCCMHPSRQQCQKDLLKLKICDPPRSGEAGGRGTTEAVAQAGGGW
jgi:hypothetical protein